MRARRPGASSTGRRRGDEGSILPLVAAFSGLALALILVAAAASSLYLDNKRLYSLADGAALAGAQSFALDDVSFDGDRVRARLESPSVEQAAADFLVVAPQTVDEVTLVRAGTDDGVTASVTVAGVWRAPFLAPFFPEGVPIEATSVARTAFR